MTSKSKKPNLFVIGAMKSGTSSLHNFLAEHPQIFMSKVKEPCHFVCDQVVERNADAYARLFDGANNEVYIGESSTQYSKLPTYRGVPERIAAHCPDAKFIYLLRDPVERSVSQYWHHYQGRRKGEEERRPMRIAFESDSRYTDYSYYAMQLRPYLKLFGTENVFVLTTEELQRSPQATLSQLFTWLKIDSQFVPGSIGKRHHETALVVSRRVRWLHRFRNSATWTSISRVVPKIVRRQLSKLAERKPVNRKSVNIDDAIEFIRPTLQKQTVELCEINGKSYDEWHTLWGR